MIKVKGSIKLERKDLDKIQAGAIAVSPTTPGLAVSTCSVSGYSFECNEFHVHIDSQQTAMASAAAAIDHLHIHTKPATTTAPATPATTTIISI